MKVCVRGNVGVPGPNELRIRAYGVPVVIRYKPLRRMSRAGAQDRAALRETLEEERMADEKLTRIAERFVNSRAR